MNLHQMEVFHAIMVHGTVTGAARALNISQPAATSVLQHAEARLKLVLFERVKGRLIPTAEAKVLFARIEQVFECVEGVRRTIDNLREARSGMLNIVAIPAVGATLVPAVIGDFLVSHPDVSIRFRMCTRHELLELVESRAAELGFGFLTSLRPSLECREIERRDLICIMPRGHPLERLTQVCAADIAPYPLVSYTSTQGLAPIVNSIFTEARINFRSGVEVGLIMNAWALVNAGTGIALVDPFSALGAMFEHVVARPFVPGTTISLEMVNSHHPLSRVAQAFVQHFGEFLRRSEPTGPPHRKARHGARR